MGRGRGARHRPAVLPVLPGGAGRGDPPRRGQLRRLRLGRPAGGGVRGRAPRHGRRAGGVGRPHRVRLRPRENRRRLGLTPRGAAWHAEGVPKLPPQDARRLLETVPVARLATVGEDARPHLVPVTFAVHRGSVYTAVDHKPKTTRDLRRLANTRANPRVALLADHYEDDWDRLWWVRVDGHAAVVDDPAKTEEPVRLLTERYPQYRDRPPEGPVIAVTIDG